MHKASSGIYAVLILMNSFHRVTDESTFSAFSVIW